MRHFWICAQLGYQLAHRGGLPATIDALREEAICRRSPGSAFALLALAGLAAPAAAQDYPARTVKIIVPFGAGGPADIYARFLGQQLQESLKQTFVVEDRPGAGSIIGTGEVAKSPPDGYTLLMMSNTHTTNETLLPNKPFQLMRDFVPVAPVNSSDLIMVVHPSVPAKDLKEFIALLKAKPGDLNYASSGPGTPYHMAGELFKAMSGTDIVHVRASRQRRRAHRRDRRPRADDDRCHHHHGADRAGGPGARAGHDRAQTRSSVLPDVPTIAEAGVPGYEATIWLGIMAPAGTPAADRRQAQRRDQQGARSSPETKEAWAKQGAEPLVMTPAEFDKYLRADIDKWAKVIQTAGIKVQ